MLFFLAWKLLIGSKRAISSTIKPGKYNVKRIVYFRAGIYAFSLFRLVLPALSVLILMDVAPGEVVAASKVSFTWQANPIEDNVIGYRLYYGSSRFDSNGVLKKGFSYDYYIDFADSVRCIAGSGGKTSCELLGTDKLHCEGLNESYPRCTVSDLHGRLYFALTAYNAQNESSYTSELSLLLNPQGLAATRQATTLLLLQE